MGPGDADVLLNVLMNPVKNGSEALARPRQWDTIVIGEKLLNKLSKSF